jgi:hypothetical protein
MVEVEGLCNTCGGMLNEDKKCAKKDPDYCDCYNKEDWQDKGDLLDSPRFE